MTLTHWIRISVFVVVLLLARRANAVVIGVCDSASCTGAKSIAFGGVVVNQTSTSSTIYLTSDTNNYAVDLVVSGCTGAASYSAQIASASTNIALKSTQNNSVDVSFTPVARGTTGTCTVNVYDAGTTTLSRASFTVSGSGVAPVVGASNVSIANPVRSADSAAIHTATANLVITNTSPDSGQVLSVTTVTSDNADWTVTPPSGSYPYSIAPNNGFNTWILTFDPSITGSDSATITIQTNDPITPTKTVTASGTGGTAEIGVTDVDFLVVQQGTASAAQDITISNTAVTNRAPMSVTSATFATNGGNWFKFNQGASCLHTTTPCTLSYSLVSSTGTVGVECAPPANATGTQMATVEITSDADTTADNTATLMCTAGATPDVDECAAQTDNCDPNATCTNTVGSFTCACNTGYTGDGTTCVATCGNGTVDPTESCDDGNVDAGDGCDAACSVETGFTCSGAPSTCVASDDSTGGGGCCSSSSAPARSVLLAMVVLGLVCRRRRSRHASR